MSTSQKPRQPRQERRERKPSPSVVQRRAMKGMSEQLRIVSYGGGVQSTALLVMAAQGRIDFQTFAFANVGDDAEHPGTIAYVRDVAMPYAAAHGIELVEVARERRGGNHMTLYEHVMSPRFKGVQIPVRFSRSVSPARRHCTRDYKIKVLAKFQRERGASASNPAIVALGISWDEMQRMRTNQDDDRIVVYPLIDMRMTRLDCMAVIREAGLPVPGRSSCWFCPHKTRGQWQRMRHEEPALFAKAVEMEAFMSGKMEAEGEGTITMHSKGSLLEITSDARQLDMFSEQEDSCESGYCMV